MNTKAKNKYSPKPAIVTFLENVSQRIDFVSIYFIWRRLLFKQNKQLSYIKHFERFLFLTIN